MALAVVSLGVIAALVVPHAAVFADAKGDVQSGINAAGGTGSGPTVDSVIQTVVKIMSLVVGILSVIMIMVGGFKYVTSGGDSGKITSAKSTVVYALIGLVIAALAQTLAKYVLANL